MADNTPTINDVFPGKSITQLMDERPGLTMGALLDKLVDKLKATETKAFKGQFDNVIYSAPLEAHSIQMQALDMALRLRGELKSKVEHTGKNGGPIEIQGLSDEQLDSKLALLLGKAGIGPALGGERAAGEEETD